MNTRNVLLTSLLACPALFAQDVIKPGAARGFASEVRSSAAAAQFNSIRLTMVLMFKDLYAKHPLAGASAEDRELIADAEDEILRVIAKQLEGLLLTYEGVEIVETAGRAVLARIYTKLGDMDSAASALEGFDPEAAAGNVLLEAVLASDALSGIRDVQMWLQIAADEAPGPDRAMDPVIIASRLGMDDAADELFESVRRRFMASAQDRYENEAALLLAEAELVVRMGMVRPIAISDATEGGGFDLDPVNKATRGLSVPSGAWDAYASSGLGDPDGSQPTEASSSMPFENQDLLQENFLRSRLFATIARHALPGLQSLDAWHGLDSFSGVGSLDQGSAPTGGNAILNPVLSDPEGGQETSGTAGANNVALSDEEAAAETYAGSRSFLGSTVLLTDPEQLFEAAVAGLLHRVIFMHPGTPAAEVAAAQRDADHFHFGSRAIPFSAPTIGGSPFELGDLADKTVLIEFASIHDPDSQAAIGPVNDLSDRYGAADFHVVRIYMDDAEDEWLLGMLAEPGRFAHVTEIFEGEGMHSDIGRLYGVTVLPTRILLYQGLRVAEADQQALTLENLDDTIQRVLRMDPEALLSDPEAAYDDHDTPTYAGPVFRHDLEILESLPVQFVLNAEVTVPFDGYVLTLDRTAQVDGVTEVFLTLMSPRADQVPERFVDINERFPLGNNIGDAVRVYIRHVTQDTASAEEARYFLDEVIPGPTQTRRTYYGPAVDIEMTGTDGIPEEITLVAVVHVPSFGYGFNFDGIRQENGTTQVLLSLTRPSNVFNNAETSGAETMRVVANLGSEVGDTIEVLVSFREEGEQDPTADYALARTLQRN